MLFLWLLYSAAMTLWTGVKPPRLIAQPSDRPDTAGEVHSPVAAEWPASAEPAEAVHLMPVAATSEALALSRMRRADAEEASLAARADC
jgi:hypothetical protein